MRIFLWDYLSKLSTFVLYMQYVIPQNRLVDFGWNLYNKTEFEFQDSSPCLKARWRDTFFNNTILCNYDIFCTFE